MGAGTKRILTEATGIKLLRALEIINDGSATTGAATTADESRILTDATGDALVDELDDLLTTLKGNLGSTRNGVAVTIEGNKASVNVTSGQYVIVQNSTISGITDGAYKAKANVNAGTSFTSSNLEAVSGGVANSLSDQIANQTLHTPNASGCEILYGGYWQIGKLIIMNMRIKATSTRIEIFFPRPYNPTGFTSKPVIPVNGYSNGVALQGIGIGVDDGRIEIYTTEDAIYLINATYIAV